MLVNVVRPTTRLSRPKWDISKKPMFSRDGGAGLKELRSRMKTVVSIEKITKSLKMVASAKMKGAQARAEQSKAFNAGMVQLFDPLFAPKPAEGAKPAGQEETVSKDQLAILMTTDKGLCGPVNTQLLRYVRNTQPEGVRYQYVVIGDKGKDIVRRKTPKDILLTAGKTAKPTFTDACFVASTLVRAGLPFTNVDSVKLFQNTAINALTFKAQHMSLALPETINKARAAYYGVNFHDDFPPTADNLAEFGLAVAIWNGLVETASVELSSRMTSMDNASRNAAEMFKKIRLIYNRRRQGAITTELTEIISGAEAAME